MKENYPLIEDTSVSRPHLFILGAGASRASGGNSLPLMTDFNKVLGIEKIISEYGYDIDSNIEKIYSDLYSNNQSEKLELLNNKIYSYCDDIKISTSPTIYDYLVLSLREKDTIATFNWDPLLFQAYYRNSNLGLKLPKLLFLHGNVSVGFCEKDKVCGIRGNRCSICDKTFGKVDLLYPIENKDYAKDKFIDLQWEQLDIELKNACYVTIFGYSGPKSDKEALKRMGKGWGLKEEREMEQIEIISRPNFNEEELHARWDTFINSHHVSVNGDFFESFITRHPRRTGEAWFQQYFMAEYLDNNTPPQDVPLEELQQWYIDKFLGYEK